MLEELKKSETLEERVARLETENAKLEEAHNLLLEQLEDLSKKAYFDELTGLMSRRAFDEEMARRGPDVFKKPNTPELRNSDKEDPENIVLVIFDIDHFKKVNDGFGHDAGDHILSQVAQTIRRYVRQTDMVARWGGEEMVVAFDSADPDGAEVKANFIRNKVEALVFDKYPDLKITISGGLASSSNFSDMKSFFKAADSALYQSKQDGRNRVTAYAKLPKNN